MHVDTLHLMQDGFRRSTKSLESMIEFVAHGGIFDFATLAARKSGRTKPIVLNRFEDDRLFVHDGLHRVASIFKGRPSKELMEPEFEIQEFTYQEYNEVNLSEKYFTPFDPRVEVRVADLANFKSQVKLVIERGKCPREFIGQNKSMYATKRETQHDSIAKMILFFCPALNAETRGD